jgi:hypothetical protein
LHLPSQIDESDVGESSVFVVHQKRASRATIIYGVMALDFATTLFTENPSVVKHALMFAEELRKVWGGLQLILTFCQHI